LPASQLQVSRGESIKQDIAKFAARVEHYAQHFKGRAFFKFATGEAPAIGHLAPRLRPEKQAKLKMCC
jgi:hypothetical protein